MPDNRADGRPTGLTTDERDRELLDFAVAQSPAIFYIADLGGKRPVTFISDNVETLTGHKPLSFLADARYGRRHIHPDDLAGYQAAIDRLPQEGALSHVYRFRAVDGDYLWFRDQLRLTRDQTTGRAGFVGCMIDITAEKLAETRLKDSETLTAAIIRSALDAVVTIDEEGLILEFNPAAERMFGYRREDAVGQPLSDLIVPEHLRERHARGLRRCRETDHSQLVNTRIEVDAMRADGSTFPVELTIARTTLGDRSVFIGEIRDMTERRAADSERRRLRRLLEAAVDGLPNGFAVSDPDGRLVLCNRAYARTYDMEPDDMVGLHRDELVRMLLPRIRTADGEPVGLDEETVRAVSDHMARADGDPSELEMKSGEWLLCTTFRTADGGSVTVRTDIGRLKETEMQLRESEAMIRRVLESCPVPIGMTRAEDGVIIYESPNSQALFGRDPMAREVSARDYFVDPADRERYLNELREKGMVDDFEVEMRRGDGTVFPALLSARLIDYQGAETIVSTTIDLTERRAVEEQMARQRDALHQSEKLGALGELLAGVAHELNNPLSVVVGQALLLKETADDPRIVERAEKIGNAADRCARIVKTFLAMARQEPGERKPINVNDAIETALEMTGYSLRASDVEVSVRLSRDIPGVWADANQLSQVLTNLIVNAQHALQEVPGPRKLWVSSSYRSHAGEVVVKIKDNGPGIPDDIGNRVFEPFFTTKEVGAGTGIGLAFCHRIVESHGGRIKVEKTPGGGATFVVRLPATTLGADVEADGADAPARRGLHALVVDDEADVAEILADILRGDGHEVDVAQSGEAALRLITRGTYDLVLTDLKMPGMDGGELYREIGDRRPGLVRRLAFITGDTMSPKARAFLESTGRPYIEKPITPTEVRNLVSLLVGHPCEPAPQPVER